MQTFARPLNLKSPSRAALQDHFDFERHAGRMVSTPAGDLIPPDALHPDGRVGAPGDTPVSLIIFPRYQAGSDLVWRPLSKAQAGLALMKCLVNARNLPEHGFPQISRLAKAVPAYHMTYAGFTRSGGELRRGHVLPLHSWLLSSSCRFASLLYQESLKPRLNLAEIGVGHLVSGDRFSQA